MVGSIFIVVAVALTLSYSQTPRYASTAKLLLRPRATPSVFGNNLQPGANAANAVATEIEVIKTEPVRQLVGAKVGSAPSVSVGQVGQTDLVTIRAENGDASRAAEVANAYANSYVEYRRRQALDDLAAASTEVQGKIADLQKQLDSLGSSVANLPVCVDARTTPDACSQRDSAQQTATQRRTALLSQLGLFQQRLDQLQVDSALTNGGASIVTPASAAASPFEPTPKRNAVLGLVLGLFLGVGMAFLIEYLDDTIKGKEDLERTVPGLAVLGLIPVVADWKASEQSRLVSVSEPNSPAAEAYRILRTSLQFLGIEKPVKLIQVTSASAQEGKTTTLANLAVAFSSAGFRTLAVCCDLRRPRLYQFFNVPNDVGFTSVLLGEAPLASALQPVPGIDRLLVLASGPLPPNPSELLSSRRAADLLRNLATQADIVLVDTPPVLPVTDALVMSQRVDSTVLISSARTTTRKAAQRAAEMLTRVNAPLVGSVLNAAQGDGDYGTYAYRYDSSLPYVANGEVRSNGAGPQRQRRRRARRDRVN